MEYDDTRDAIPGRGPRNPHHDRGGRSGWAGRSRDDFTGRPTTPPERPEGPFGAFGFGWGPFAGGPFANRPYDGRGRGPKHPFGPFMSGPGSAGGARTPRGGIRLGLLALLAESEQNGYGAMKAFEAKSNGNWAPKAGTVYPALGQLVGEGLAEVNDEGVYGLTEAGQVEAARNAELTEALFQRMISGEEETDLFTASRLLAKALFDFGGQHLGREKEAEIAGKLNELRKEIYRKLGE